ncbi:MAG: phosphomethylpyrimidine synthase ThiC [Pseudomonadota bacterium]
MTQLSAAKHGVTTNEMIEVSKYEGIPVTKVRDSIADGNIVIPYNPKHAPSRVRAIGEGTRVKVNVNLGTSENNVDLDLELKKIELAQNLGADAVMDLSTSGDLKMIRSEILSRSEIPVGTVPLYEIFELAKSRDGDFADMSIDDIFEVIARQAEDGVDFMTIHAGINRSSLEKLHKQERILGVVSRGGALLSYWMKKNNKENPLFEHYDDLLNIMADYDVTLSLGDALRPGCINDATDRGQMEELLILGEMADRARDKNVQVIIEGPGHIPLDQIALNIKIQKCVSRNTPFYVCTMCGNFCAIKLGQS